MKLKSEIEQCGARMSVNYFDRDELNHDAMAAHALLQAMDAEIQRVSQVPYNSREICVHFMENVKKRAAEILAGWLGEERKS